MADINMFGPGGEDLAGLYGGQNLAQAQAAKDAATQNTLASIANTQALTRGHELENQMNSELMPDKIAAYRTQQINDAQDRQATKTKAMGEQLGQMSNLLSTVPPAARHAALTSIAAQYGVDQNHPIMQHFMDIDPEELPKQLSDYSQKAFAASDAAKTQAQKAADELARTKEQGASGERVANIHAGATIRAAEISAAARENAANARAGGKGGGSIMDQVAAGKITPDKAIAYYELKDADSGLEDSERSALQRLKEYQLNKQVVRSTGSTENILGLPTPQERVSTAAGAPKSPPGTPDIGALVKRSGQEYQPDKYDYRITPDGRVQRKAK